MDTRSLRHAVRSSVLLPLLCATTALAAPTPTPPASGENANAEAKVDLKLLASGAMPKLGGYRPQQLKLSETKPAALKKAPELSSPRYGEIRFAGRTFIIASDEPKSGGARLYVDANGNGDLTDDPQPKWEKGDYRGPNGPLVRYSGSIQLPIRQGGKDTLVSLGAYRFDNNDPQRQQIKDTLLYYSDYAYDGDVTLAGKTYHAMLADDNATGEFAPSKDAKGPGSRFMIDINGDGKFSPRGEVFQAGKPFNIKGTTWVVAAPQGESAAPVAIALSDQKVEEVALPPNHSVGQKITPFTAERMDGKPVNFPADYKGKIVLLDFWATWCGPCIAEVDGLVSAYNEYHPQGVEILGISLDQPGAADMVKNVTGEKGMTWPQVYDGKFWQAAVAQKYGIDSIPSAFLVDGDTGEILAAGGSLRGTNLAGTLKAAVEKKQPQAGAQTAKSEDQNQGEQKKPAAPAKAQPF